MSLKILAGYLVSGQSQPDVDVPKVVQRLDELGFDGIHFFEHPIWARFTPAQEKFTYWTDNSWMDQALAWREECAARRMILYTTVFDQYGDRFDWFPNPLGGIAVKHLYGTTRTFNENFLAWTVNDGDPTSVYKLRPPYGPAIGEFLVARAKMEADCQKRFGKKSWRIDCLFNEEYAANRASDGKAVAYRGGEDKIKNWYREQILLKNGVVMNKHYRLAINFENYLDPARGGGPKNFHWPIMVKNIKLAIWGSQRALWEVHNIGPEEVDLILAENLEPRRIVFSTDARPDHPAGTVDTIKKLKGLNTIYIMKAGLAGKRFEKFLPDSNVFINKTLRKLAKLKDAGLA